MYNHRVKSQYTLAENEQVVGKRAVLAITGEIVEARESEAGSFVVFEPDERWGMAARLGMDRECFEIQED